jgi:hypothetical protein
MTKITIEINDKFTKIEGKVTRKNDDGRALAGLMESVGLANIGAALMMPLTPKLSKKDALMYADAVKNAIEATEEKDFLQE